MNLRQNRDSNPVDKLLLGTLLAGLLAIGIRLLTGCGHIEPYHSVDGGDGCAACAFSDHPSPECLRACPVVFGHLPDGGADASSK